MKLDRIFLILLMSLSLAACSTNNGQANNPGGNQPGNGGETEGGGNGGGGNTNPDQGGDTEGGGGGFTPTPDVDNGQQDAWNNPFKYYASVDDSLMGEDLMNKLADICSHGFVQKSYSSLDDLYSLSDPGDKPGTVKLAYTGTDRAYHGNPGSAGCNKEHVWPQSWYGIKSKDTSQGGPGSDAHNVLICESKLNGDRGCLPYDDITYDSRYYLKEFGGTAYATPGKPETYAYIGPSKYNSERCVMPSKGHRGQIARCILYVATRYHKSSWPVQVVDETLTTRENGKYGRIGKLSTLLKWHFEELPTEREIARNNVVAKEHHHNRNPFVDHPEYASRIWSTYPDPKQGIVTQDVKNVLDKYANFEPEKPVAPTSIEVTNKTISLVKGETQEINASVKPDNANQAMTYASNNANVATVDASGKVTAVGQGTCTITLKTKADTTITNTVSVTVKELKSIAISGTASKTTYNEGDTFSPDGLTVTATYTDNTTSIISNNKCSWLDGSTNEITLTQGTTTVTCKYGEKTVTYTGIVVNERLTGFYKQVTQNIDDLSGTYLIVGKSDNSASILNGGVTIDTDNKDNNKSANIVNNSITGDFENCTFTITKNSNGKYKITSTLKNETIGSNSTSKLKVSNEYENDISINAKGDAIIVCQGFTLRYNANQFRYYTNSTQGLAIQLFKA